MEFNDKVAIVTGGAMGMGAAYVKILAERGARVAIADVNVERAQQTADEVTAAGGRAFVVRTDVGSLESVNACAAAVLGEYGGIDYLINNAGLLSAAREKPLHEIDWDRYLSITSIMMHGALMMTRAVLPSMRARGGGSIVNTSSIGAYTANGIYSLTKLGINGITVALAKELAPYGIRVNAIAPGAVMTEGNKGIDLDEAGLKAWVARMGKKTDYVGTPEDVARVGVFLLSNEASYVSGQILAVDGATLTRV